MSEHAGVALTWLGFFEDASGPLLGLDPLPTIEVFRASDSTKLVNFASCTEVGGGWYKYTGAANLFPTEDLAPATMYNNDVDVTPLRPAVPAGWVIGKGGVEHLDAAISSRLATAAILLAAGKVTVGTNDDKTNYQLAADQAVNVAKVAGAAVSGVDDFKANVSTLALQSTLVAIGDLLSLIPVDPFLLKASGYSPGTHGYNLARIGDGAYDLLANVLRNGDISLIAGNDYTDETSNPLTFTEQTGENWPNLSGVIRLITDVGEFEGEIVTANTFPRSVKVELTAADVANLVARPIKYHLDVVLASSAGQRTLRKGRMLKEVKPGS